MGLRTWLRPTVTVDEGFEEQLELTEEGQHAVIIRPPKERTEDALEIAEAFWRDVHDGHDQFATEISQTPDGEITFRVVAETRADADRLRQQLMSFHDEIEVDLEPASVPIEAGDVVAASRIEYAEDYMLLLPNKKSANSVSRDPYRSLLNAMADAQGTHAIFQTVVEPVSNSWTVRWTRGFPFKRERPKWWKLPTSRNTRIPAVKAMVVLTLLWVVKWIAVSWWTDQAVLSASRQYLIELGLLATLIVGPAVLGVLWWRALFGDRFIPKRLTAATLAQILRDKPWTPSKPTRSERRTADMIAEQKDGASYRVSMRLITIAETSAEACEYQDRLGQSLENSFHDRITSQRLSHRPAGPWFRSIVQLVKQTASRTPSRPGKWRNKLFFRAKRKRPMYMCDFELASAVHWPDSSGGGVGAINYAIDKGDSLPPGAKNVAAGVEENAPDAPLDDLADAGRLDEDTTQTAANDTAPESAFTSEPDPDTDSADETNEPPTETAAETDTEV